MPRHVRGVASAVSFASDRPVTSTTTRYTGTALDFASTDSAGHSMAFSAGKGDGVSPMQVRARAIVCVWM